MKRHLRLPKTWRSTPFTVANLPVADVAERRSRYLRNPPFSRFLFAAPPELPPDAPRKSPEMPAALALNAPLVRCGAATERVRRTAAAHVAPRGLGIATPSRSRAVAPVAALPKKEKSITRDDEPEEYWSSKAERGGNPMKVNGSHAMDRAKPRRSVKMDCAVLLPG